jgi:ABC-type transport system involved in multi-copper enzyme maturation permease subunit
MVTLTETFPRIGANGDKDKHAKAGAARVRLIFQKAEDLGFLTIQDIVGEFQPPADGNGASRFYYHVTLQGNSQTVRMWSHEPSLLFGAAPLEILAAPLAYQLHVLGQTVLSFGAWVAILVGVVITSFFIPSMLSKGTVDMLLVKPIQRWALLLYKYVGGLTFVFLNTAYAVVGLWLVVGLRTGVWANGLILLVVTITFYFAILYAVSTFVSVMTRNTIATIIVTILAWFLFFAVGLANKNFDLIARAEARQQKREQNDGPAEGRWGNSYTAQAVRVLHTITPRTEELNQLNERITYYAFMTGSFTQMWKFDTGEASAWESLLVSFSWIGVFLGLGCVFFSFKNF